MTKTSALMALILCGTVAASAGTISSFTAVAAPSTPFSVTGLNLSFTGSLASVSGTVSCVGATACSGAALLFSLGVTGLSASTPISADIIGSATAAASGAFVETSPTSATIPFTLASGPFNKIIFSSSLPAVGTVLIGGTLSLAIPAGQSITLPLDFMVGAQTVPEPSTLALLGLGLIGVASKLRRRAAK